VGERVRMGGWWRASHGLNAPHELLRREEAAGGVGRWRREPVAEEADGGGGWQWRALEKLESCRRVRADLRCYEKRARDDPSKARVQVVASEPRFECGACIATMRGDGGGVGRWWRESVVDEVDGGGP
jgi:hypothetical protein